MKEYYQTESIETSSEWTVLERTYEKLEKIKNRIDFIDILLSSDGVSEMHRARIDTELLDNSAFIEKFEAFLSDCMS